MRPCKAIKQFDVAYHQVMEAIGMEDREALRFWLSMWIAARKELAEQLRKAAKKGRSDVVSAIDRMVNISLDSIDKDAKHLQEKYPEYLSARDLANQLVCTDIISRISGASELRIGVDLPGFRADVDIKKLLAGRQ